MDKLSKILNGLTGIIEGKQPESYQQQASEQLVLLTGLHEPPSYFVYILMKIAGFTPHNDWDKSRWQFYVHFKNIHFCIRDFKMMTWSIDALDASIDKESAKGTAEELRGRISKTSRNLDKLLKPMLQDFIDKDNYALPNSYRHLRNLYDYFREQVEEILSKINQMNSNDKPVEKELSVEGFLADRVKLYNQEREYERIATYNACAMVSFFFSYVEFLMDILFIFYPVEHLSLHDFQNLDWRGRFNSVFPVAKDTTIEEIYRVLLDIRGQYVKSCV